MNQSLTQLATDVLPWALAVLAVVGIGVRLQVLRERRLARQAKSPAVRITSPALIGVAKMQVTLENIGERPASDVSLVDELDENGAKLFTAHLLRPSERLAVLVEAPTRPVPEDPEKLVYEFRERHLVAHWTDANGSPLRSDQAFAIDFESADYEFADDP